MSLNHASSNIAEPVLLLEGSVEDTKTASGSHWPHIHQNSLSDANISIILYLTYISISATVNHNTNHYIDQVPSSNSFI